MAGDQCGEQRGPDFEHRTKLQTTLGAERGKIAALMTAMIGVGTQGGAEALFHQLVFDEWMADPLVEPLAWLKVDEKKKKLLRDETAWTAVRNSACGLCW